MGRLRYLCYRCYHCAALITAIELEKRWDEASDSDETTTSCVCGSNKVTPTNPTSDESARYESWWQEVRYFFGKRDDGTKLVELYYDRVKNVELGKEYTKCNDA